MFRAIVCSYGDVRRRETSWRVNCVRAGMFLEKKAFSGEEADKMTIDKFVDDWEHLKFQPPLCNYAQLLPRD